MKRKIVHIQERDQYERLKEAVTEADRLVGVTAREIRGLGGTEVRDAEEAAFLDSVRASLSTLNNHHHEAVTRIDRALDKIEHGVYGFCEECDNEISRERLRAEPSAELCRECQEAADVRKADRDRIMKQRKRAR